MVLKGGGFRPSVQGQGLKRGGRDGGTFRKMVSIWLKKKKKGNIAHIVIYSMCSFISDRLCEVFGCEMRKTPENKSVMEKKLL